MNETPIPANTQKSGWHFSSSLYLICAAGASFALAITFVLEPTPSGLGAWYERYATLIRHRFDPTGAEPQTFPMWGYGWLLAVVPDARMWVVVQILFGFTGAAVLLSALVTTCHLTLRNGRIGAWCLAAYLPWYASLISAYSAPAIAVGLLLFSLSFLVRWLGQAGSSHQTLLLAALTFGLMLNFRSDYFLFTLVVAAVLVVSAGFRRRGLAAAAIWLSVVLLTLVPWLVYTKTATGRMTFTSTNSGHVLFLGWGDLPSNPWGISVSDGDPVMARELAGHFGRPVSSLSAEGDRFLRARFTETVRTEPGLYGQRLAKHTLNLALGGFYPGVWDADFRERVREQFPVENLNTVLMKHWREVFGLASGRTALQVLAEIQSRLGFVLLGIAGIAAARFAAKTRDWVLILFVLGAFYQITVSMMAHYLRPPLNNQIVPMLCLGLWLAGRIPASLRNKVVLSKQEDLPP